MITMSEAARKYGVNYGQVQNWVNSGYIETVDAYPGTGRRDQAIGYKEEQVLEAMVLLYKAGVKTEVGKFLGRGSSTHIRALERALDKCKYIRASHISEASGG